MTTRLILTFILFLYSGITIAQEIDVILEDVVEKRHKTKHKSHLYLDIRVNGIEVDKTNKIQLLEITKAIDNEGRQVKMKRRAVKEYSSINKLTIKLEATERNATKLESLEGTIGYFTPSESNNSKVIVEKPLSKLNKNLLEGTNNETKLFLVDRKTLVEKGSNTHSEFLKIAKELEESGKSKPLSSQPFARMRVPENCISFLVEDEKKRLVKILVLNEKGKIMNGTYATFRGALSITLPEKPNPNWTLEILIENEFSLKELNFSLSNILMP